MKSFVYLLAVVLLLWSGFCKAMDCSGTGDNKRPCRCKGNGDGINIELGEVAEKFASKNIPDPNDTKYSYRLSLCKPISCNATDPNQDIDAAGCQIIASQEGHTPKLGEVNSFQWDITSETVFAVTYADGDPIDKKTVRAVRVEYTVLANLTEPSIIFAGEHKENDIDTYRFTAQISKTEEHENATSAAKDISGYIGIILIILVILGLLAYFVIGSIVKYKVQGARGAEMIPNYGFWATLPIHIKDGFIFTFSPCCGKLKGSGYQSL